MPTKNHGRMAQDMKREIIAIIGEMKDPRVNGGLLTVTRVFQVNQGLYDTVVLWIRFAHNLLPGQPSTNG